MLITEVKSEFYCSTWETRISKVSSLCLFLRSVGPKLILRRLTIVKEGDRIAQLILEKIVTPEPQEVSSLDETVRGAGGFGSTGGFGVAAPAVPAVDGAEKK
jgi:hypothetical protein